MGCVGCVCRRFPDPGMPMGNTQLCLPPISGSQHRGAISNGDHVPHEHSNNKHSYTARLHSTTHASPKLGVVSGLRTQRKIRIQGEGSGYESLASSAATLASRTSRGMVFTPVGSALPASPARRLAQTIFIMRDRAASVALPVWGVITTWGHDRRGWSSGRGSGSKTTVQRSSHTPG